MVHYNFAYPNHIIFDLYGVNKRILDDEKRIKAFFEDIARKINSEVIHTFTRKFDPHGLIVVSVLLQSHIAYHSWPEFGYAALDIFACSNVPVDVVEEDVKRFFRPKKIEKRTLSRLPDKHKELATWE